MPKVSEIFKLPADNSNYTKTALLELELQDHFVEALARKLDLAYLTNSKSDHVCYMGNEEVMPSYRIQFTEKDVKNYLSRFFKNDISDIDQLTIPMPEDPEEFFANR